MKITKPNHTIVSPSNPSSRASSSDTFAIDLHEGPNNPCHVINHTPKTNQVFH